MSTMNIPAFGVTVASKERTIARVHRITVPWHRLALGMITLLAAFLNFFQLSREGFANSYYAAAVKSMSMNWHNFFFAAFDPSGFVTIDKPPLGFWFQVASVKLFGFNGVSLLLPEGVAGILSVVLLYHLVKRMFGQPAGLLAALFMAITPVAIADNRNNTIDSILVLFMLLGAWAVSRAVEQRRDGNGRTSGLRWLLLCAVFVGLGFNIKMMEAFLVVPAFGLVYLLGAQVRWRTRVVHLLFAAILMLTVSLSWAVAVDLTPASQRPWVDSTTSNSEIDLAIGYNGLQRLLGSSGTPTTATAAASKIAATSSATSKVAMASNSASKAVVLSSTTSKTSSVAATTAMTATASTTSPTTQSQGSGGGSLFNNGAAGPLRLIDSELGSQAGWLIPLALFGLLAAGSRRLRFPLEGRQKGLVLWGAWLPTMAGFFSVAGFFHSYYLVTLAPAIAALAAIGLVSLWQDYRQHRSLKSWRGWMLPVALLVTAAAQVHILSGYPAWSSWMDPIVLAGTIIPAVVLVAARCRPHRRLTISTMLAVAVGSLALLVAPTVWAANTVSTVGSSIPSAGPSVQSSSGTSRGGFGGTAGSPPSGVRPSGALSGVRPTGGNAGEMPTGGTMGQAAAGGGSTGTDSQLLAYLLKNQGSTKYLLVTSSSNSAASYIISTGKPVMSLGGFGGNDPILTLTQFKALVKNNTVRYVLGGGGGGQGSSSTVMQWVQSSCRAVTTSTSKSTSSTTTTASAVATGSIAGGSSSSLYDCAGAL